MDLNVFPIFPKITVSWLYDTVVTKCYICEHRTNTSWLGSFRFHSWSSNLMSPLFFVVLFHIPLRKCSNGTLKQATHIAFYIFNNSYSQSHFNDWTSFVKYTKESNKLLPCKLNDVLYHIRCEIYLLRANTLARLNITVKWLA